VSLTGGTKCLFGRSGHRFDKHVAREEEYPTDNKGEKLNLRDTRYFHKLPSRRRDASCWMKIVLARSRTSKERRKEKERERKRERERERERKSWVQRDLSAFNGPALVKSCTKTLSTTLSKLCQQGLVANSWPRLPSYFEINSDLFMSDDTNVFAALRTSIDAQTVLRGKRLCARLCRTICLQGCISRINERYRTVVVESITFGERSAKARCLSDVTKFTWPNFCLFDISLPLNVYTQKLHVATLCLSNLLWFLFLTCVKITLSFQNFDIINL